MAEEFLEHQDIPSAVSDLKDGWYGIAQKYEALMDNKSGLDEAVEGLIQEIMVGAEGLKKKAKVLNVSIKRSVPDKRTQVDELGGKITGILQQFYEASSSDLKDIKESKRLHKALAEATSMLEETEKKFREVEGRTSEVCARYFDRNGEYTQQAELIKNSTRERAEGIRKKHIPKLKEVCQGYEIYLSGKNISVDSFFDLLLERPKGVETVSLVRKEEKKGLLDSFTKKKDAETSKEAKYAVLKYTAKEIATAVAPIKKEETQALVRLDTKFGDLRKLEFECRDAEQKREEVARPREELKREIARLRKSDLLSLNTYDHVMKVHDKYLKMFEEATPAVKEYIAFLEGAMEGYEVPEKDVEKRELKAEIKRLKENKAALEDEVITLNKNIQKLIDEIASLKKANQSQKTQLDEGVKREAEIKERLQTMEASMAKIRDKYKELGDLL